MQFSIIVPLYNKENFISNSIYSIINQNHKDFEILIINDGSTDNSLKNVEMIKDNRLRIINQKNNGVSSARNRGVSESKYDFVAFLDADDLWETEYLSEIIKLIQDFPECGLYTTSYISKREDKQLDHRSKIVPNNFRGIIDDYFDFINHNQAFCSSSVVARKNIFEKVGLFPEGIIKREDYDTWIRFFLYSKIVFINSPLIIYLHDSQEKPYHKCDENFNYYDIEQLKKYLDMGLVKKEHQNNAKKYIIRHEIPILRRMIREKEIANAISKIFIIWKIKHSRLKLIKLVIKELLKLKNHEEK